VQYAVLDGDRMDDKWMEDDLVVDGYDIKIGGAVFNILKLVELSSENIGTVEDLRSYFEESEDETSPFFNPYEDKIEKLFENSPGSGNNVRVILEGDIEEIANPTPNYRFLLLEFEKE